MQIEITSRHAEISDRVKEYLKEKVEKLSRYYPNIVNCQVVLDRQKEGEMVEVNLHISGKNFITKVTTDNLIKSIDTAIDKIEVQLKKFKEKRYEK
ncbi:MAG: ribosome-associated translation inhibitor RaiA [Candidatus Marinimicrobia bacterium]|nr:ribosome-associated translation inhibitor RaiA [Candidatus Neomarinimicrobiota bacterium]